MVIFDCTFVIFSEVLRDIQGDLKVAFKNKLALRHGYIKEMINAKQITQF